MRTSQTFSINFWAYTARTKHNLAPLYVRLSINGKKVNVSLKYKVPIDLWDANAQRLNGKSKAAQAGNLFIEETRTKIFQNYQDHRFQNKKITSELLKNNFLGEGPKGKTLLNAIDYHAVKIEATLAAGSIRNFNVTEKYVRKYLKQELKSDDIYLSELNYRFINDFAVFLFKYWPKGHINNMANNTVMKHAQRLRKIVTLAFHREWVDKDPFVRWHPTFEDKRRDFLNANELKLIEDFDFASDGLDRVRDLFVFSCYTGIPFSDILELSENNILTGMDNNKWIFTKRSKTNTPVKVPLLKKALQLLEKYEDHPMSVIRNKLFPKISNGKVNQYLKEVANFCGIKKNLTFHMARHTFATTITLANGVPIETVSKLLGDTKIATTQIYARVLENKLSEDMLKLQNKLDDKENK